MEDRKTSKGGGDDVVLSLRSCHGPTEYLGYKDFTLQHISQAQPSMALPTERVFLVHHLFRAVK